MADYQDVLDNLSTRYPQLAPHLKNTVISRGNPSEANGRLLEYYPPWEDDNPTPGKSHTQIFDPKLTGDSLHGAVAADMLHLLGAVDPRTGEPIDANFLALKNKMAEGMTPEHHRTNLEAYKMDKRDFGDVGSYDDWMKNSRIDAYSRAGVFPEQNPEWKGFLTPQQEETAGQMRSYLESAPQQSQPAPASFESGIGLALPQE